MTVVSRVPQITSTAGQRRVRRISAASSSCGGTSCSVSRYRRSASDTVPRRETHTVTTTPISAPRMMGSAQTGKATTSSNASAFGTTLPAKPATMPQKAPASVMRRLQTLMKATGPQDDAKTVPAKYVIQKMLGGTNMASASAAIPTTSMVQRLIQIFAASLAVPGFATSWLALKATRERNGVADD